MALSDAQRAERKRIRQAAGFIRSNLFAWPGLIDALELYCDIEINDSNDLDHALVLVLSEFDLSIDRENPRKYPGLSRVTEDDWG